MDQTVQQRCEVENSAVSCQQQRAMWSSVCLLQATSALGTDDDVNDDDDNDSNTNGNTNKKNNVFAIINVIFIILLNIKIKSIKETPRGHHSK